MSQFEDAVEKWERIATGLADAREQYTQARAAAVLAAKGKNAEAREAEARLATEVERIKVAHLEVAEQAASWTVQHLLRIARPEKAA